MFQQLCFGFAIPSPSSKVLRHGSVAGTRHWPRASAGWVASQSIQTPSKWNPIRAASGGCLCNRPVCDAAACRPIARNDSPLLAAAPAFGQCVSVRVFSPVCVQLFPCADSWVSILRVVVSAPGGSFRLDCSGGSSVLQVRNVSNDGFSKSLRDGVSRILCWRLRYS